MVICGKWYATTNKQFILFYLFIEMTQFIIGDNDFQSCLGVICSVVHLLCFRVKN